MKESERAIFEEIRRETEEFNKLQNEDILDFYLLGGFKSIIRRNDEVSSSIQYMSFNDSIYSELTSGVSKGLFEPVKFFDELYRCVEQNDLMCNKLGRPLNWIAYCNSLRLKKAQGDYLFQKLAGLGIKLERSWLSDLPEEQINATEYRNPPEYMIDHVRIPLIYNLCITEDLFVGQFTLESLLNCFDLNNESIVKPVFKSRVQWKFVYILSQIKALGLSDLKKFNEIVHRNFGIKHYYAIRQEMKPTLGFKNSVNKALT